MDEMEQQEAFWKGTHVADRKDEEHNIFYISLIIFTSKYSITGNRTASAISGANRYFRIEMMFWHWPCFNKRHYTICYTKCQFS
jgi:hypothetical protein